MGPPGIGQKAESIDRLKTHSRAQRAQHPCRKATLGPDTMTRCWKRYPVCSSPLLGCSCPEPMPVRPLHGVRQNARIRVARRCGTKYTQEAQDKPSEKKIMDLITSLSKENSLMEVLPRLVEPIEDDTAHLPSYDVPAPPS